MPITTHHDGHGLNEGLEIYCDNRDPKAGGASHDYTIHAKDPGAPVAQIQFQHGPREEDGSKHGCTEASLLAILIDRMEAFQAGPYACHENDMVKTKLQEALFWTRYRVDERAKRGVLGRNQK